MTLAYKHAIIGKAEGTKIMQDCLYFPIYLNILSSFSCNPPGDDPFYVSYSLISLKGGYIGGYIGDYYRGY